MTPPLPDRGAAPLADLVGSAYSRSREHSLADLWCFGRGGFAFGTVHFPGSLVLAPGP